jgi:ribulose-phosphate 3-epimerase
MIKIAPSLLSADFARLGEDIDSVKTADYLHFDVMDGIFVPNISVGLPVLKSVRRYTDMPIDVHLMITKPLRYVKDFAEAGADIIVVHLEADGRENIHRAIDTIHSLGKLAGLSIKPGTPASDVEEYLSKLDLVLIMTVEPGFGGQKFMADMMSKVSYIKSLIREKNLKCLIEIDGGINPDTAAVCAAAGADILVAGSDVFRAENRAERIELLRRSDTIV